MLNQDGEKVCLPEPFTKQPGALAETLPPEVDSLSQYNFKLSSVGLPTLSSSDELASLRIAFEEKEEWSNLIKLSASQKESISGTISNKSKCEWGDIDHAIIISFSGDKSLSSTPLEWIGEGTEQESVPFLSEIKLMSELSSIPYTPTHTHSPEEDKTNNIAISRAISIALGHTVHALEKKGLIQRHPVFNECGDKIRDDWPFFVGENAVKQYRDAVGDQSLIGVPMHGFVGEAESSDFSVEGYWHTKTDPDKTSPEAFPTGEIYLEKDRKESTFISTNPLDSFHTDSSSRRNVRKELVYYPGISNEEINSFPWGMPGQTNKTISSITKNAMVDIGYESCNPAEAANIEAGPNWNCCRLALEVLTAQNKFATNIEETGFDSSLIWEEKSRRSGSPRVETEKRVANVFSIDRIAPEEVIKLSATNTDGIYTGEYTYSIIEARGIDAEIIGTENHAAPLAAQTRTNFIGLRRLARNKVYGKLNYITNINDIELIDINQRYLLISGQGAGYVKIKVVDQKGCEETITITVDPANFQPCNYIAAGMQDLTINTTNYIGLQSWPTAAVLSSWDQDPMPARNIPAGTDGIFTRNSRRLTWAWDATFQENPNQLPPNVGMIGKGTQDTQLLELIVTASGGVPFPTNGPNSLPNGARYIVHPLNDNVYVTRTPSDDPLDPDFHGPENRAWLENGDRTSLGFIYGGDTPQFESSSNIQVGNMLASPTNSAKGRMGFQDPDGYYLYANKPGRHCFFKIEDYKGCIKTLELMVPCTNQITELDLPPGNSLPADGTETSVPDYYNQTHPAGLGTVPPLINIGLGDIESANMEEILSYNLGESMAERRVDNLIYNGQSPNYQNLPAAWYSRLGHTSYIQPPVNSNINCGHIPGITHEVFTGRRLECELKGGSVYNRDNQARNVYPSIKDQVSWEYQKGEIPQGGNRKTKDVNPSRIVKIGQNNGEFEFSGLNIGHATKFYTISDGVNECSIEIIISVNSPTIIYGDFIQGHTHLDRPYKEGNAAPDFTTEGAYRVEEQFYWAEGVLNILGIPTIIGAQGQSATNDPNPLFNRFDAGFPSDGMSRTIERDTEMIGSLNAGDPGSISVDPADFINTRTSPEPGFNLPLGISAPCGKGFFGIKITSAFGNYHRDTQFRRHDMGWCGAFFPGAGAPIQWLPHQPSNEVIKRRATGWKFDLLSNQDDISEHRLERVISGAGEWGNANEMYPHRFGESNFIARWDQQNQLERDPIIWGTPGWHCSRTGSNNAALFAGIDGVMGHDSGREAICQKSYDIVVGPIVPGDFKGFDINWTTPQEALENFGLFNNCRVFLRPTWEPFAESRIPPRDLPGKDSQGVVCGFAWQWPQLSYGEPIAAPDIALPENQSISTLPMIKLRPDAFFNNSSAINRRAYRNPEFQCETLIAVGGIAALTELEQNTTFSGEEFVKLQNSLDSACDQGPVDNIIVGNPEYLGTGLNDLIGTWVKITWEPGYNDDPDNPLHTAPAPHQSIEEWKINNPGHYEEELRNELTKCYKLISVQNDQDFLDWKKDRTTSDGKKGMHKRNIGEIDDGPTNKGYTDCEECSLEVVMTSCDGTSEFLLKFPDFRQVDAPKTIFNKNLRWPVSYRILEGLEEDEELISSRDCFQFEKKIATEGVTVDEHGNITGGKKLKEVEIQNFSAPIEEWVPAKNEFEQKALKISPEKMLERFSDGKTCITETMDMGYETRTIETCALESCEECHDVSEMPEFSYDDPLFCTPEDSTDDPEITYGDESISPCEDPLFEIDDTSAWPSCPQFEVAVSYSSEEITVSVSGIERPDHVEKIEEIIYGDPQPLPFRIIVTHPEGSETKDNTVISSTSFSESFSVSPWESGPSGDFQGKVEVWFGGLAGCYRKIKFDFSCGTFVQSAEYMYDDETCSGEELESNSLYTNCPCANDCPSCEVDHEDMVTEEVEKLYKQAAIIVSTQKPVFTTLLNEKFRTIKTRMIEPGEEVIFIDDEEVEREVYNVVMTPTSTEYYHPIRNPDRSSDERVFVKDEYQWKYSECRNPSFNASGELPNQFIDQVCNEKFEQGIDACPTGLKINYPLNNRYIFLLVKQVPFKDGDTCQPRPPKMYQQFRPYDGIKYTASKMEEFSQGNGDVWPSGISKGDSIVFGKQTTEEASAQRASEISPVAREILLKKEDKEKIFPEEYSTMLGIDRQVKTEDSRTFLFAHHQGGNKQNNSPEGSLGEASDEEINNFISQLIINDQNSSLEFGSTTEVRIREFLWTSRLPIIGIDSSVKLSIITPESYSDISILGAEKIEGKTVVDIQNESDTSYIIEACLDPSKIENFESYEGTANLKPVVAAISKQSRETWNSESNGSLFFEIAANTITKIELGEQEILNQENSDNAVNFFYRAVGSFSGVEANEENTELYTSDALLTLNMFDLWLLLPPEHSSKRPFQRLGGAETKINTMEEKNISRNGELFKLIKIQSSLSSSQTISSLVIK